MPKYIGIRNSIKTPVFCQFKLLPFYQPISLIFSGSPCLQMEIKNLHDLAAIYLPSLLYPLTTSKMDIFLPYLFSNFSVLYLSVLCISIKSKILPPSIKIQFKCHCLQENILCIYSSYLYSSKKLSLPQLKSLIFILLMTFKILALKLVYCFLLY